MGEMMRTLCTHLYVDTTCTVNCKLRIVMIDSDTAFINFTITSVTLSKVWDAMSFNKNP